MRLVEISTSFFAQKINRHGSLVYNISDQTNIKGEVSMSYIDSTKKCLNIKDNNVTFTGNYYNKTIDKITYTDYEAVVDENFTTCSKCGSRVIRYGRRISYIKSPDCSYNKVRIRLIKQRYQCSHCRAVLTSQSRELTDPGCYISNKIKQKISTLFLEDPLRNMKSVSIQLGISFNTIWRRLNSCYKGIDEVSSLPEEMCIDEFKATKSCKAGMAFITCDARTHNVKTILPTRKKNDLIEYYQRFPYEERSRVKSVVMDMHSPYADFIHDVFPNAKIVIDKFHIVQLISRSMNKARIKYMNEIRTKNPVMYRRLKNNWKLFLKFKSDLKMERPEHFNKSFKAYISESEVLAHLISHSSEELRETYNLYQRLLYSIRLGFENLFVNEIESLQNRRNPSISKDMKKSIRTLRKFRSEIHNTFQTNLTNGCLEGINNLIKTVKRVSFGYRNFEHFQIRIRLALSHKIIAV